MKTSLLKWPRRLVATQLNDPELSETSAPAVPYRPSILGLALLALDEPLLTRVRVMGFEPGATRTISNREGGANGRCSNQVKALREWWPGTELNRRRQPFQGCALPPELPGHSLQKARATVPHEPCSKHADWMGSDASNQIFRSVRNVVDYNNRV